MPQERATVPKEDSVIVVSTLKSFDNDTVQYLNENFKKHKQFYAHKKLSVLIDSLEIPIKSYLIGEKFNQPDSVPEITLVFTDMTKLLVDKHYEKYKLMTIKLQQSVSKANSLKLLGKTKGIWNNEAYEFYKDYIVEDIIMVER